jgi:hypothetical protein
MKSEGCLIEKGWRKTERALAELVREEIGAAIERAKMRVTKVEHKTEAGSRRLAIGYKI